MDGFDCAKTDMCGRLGMERVQANECIRISIGFEAAIFDLMILWVGNI